MQGLNNQVHSSFVQSNQSFRNFFLKISLSFIVFSLNYDLKFKKASKNADKSSLDTFIVMTFHDLLSIFNNEEKSYELRSLILECMELLLNNLLIEQQQNYETNQNSYQIKHNHGFVEFGWQHFCPCILFQFGDCGLPAKLNAPQSITFKQIYTILIQLTGLVGGCDEMISVFEAIFQRILFYPPEQDKHLLLKLFKTVILTM
jgi:hypothetical protein